MIKIQNLASFIYILANAFDPKERIPGKNIRWDPRCVPGGIPPFSGGIPGGIMEHPAWDPTWDYGTSRMGSHLGLWNIPHGIPLGIMEHPAWDPTWDYGTSRMGSHLGLWNIPHRIPHGIMEHPTRDPTWDYGTSCMGSHLGLWNIPHGILPIEFGIPL